MKSKMCPSKVWAAGNWSGINQAKQGKSEDQALPGSRKGGAGASHHGVFIFHFCGRQAPLPALCWERGKLAGQ